MRSPLILLVATLLPYAAQGQARGRALYDLMGRERLVTVEGTPQVRWTPRDGAYFFLDTSGSGAVFRRVDARTGRVSPLFADKLAARLLDQYQQLGGRGATGNGGLPFRTFEYVQDGRAIQFAAGEQTWLFDLEREQLVRLPRPRGVRPEEVEGLMRGLQASQLVRGTYSPDYSRTAYVRGFDLFMLDAGGTETQLTMGGSEELMNGRPDWVYPEELGQDIGFVWSPDSKRLAYLQWDERPVVKYPIIHELSVPARLEQQRYPKAGAPNPIVRLFVVDLTSGSTKQIESASSGDVYIVKPTWRPDGKALTFQRLNRRQNVLQLLSADPTTGTVRQILREEEQEFVTLHDDFRFIDNGGRFIWSSERSGLRQLYVYSSDGRTFRQITTGDWPVSRVVSVDEEDGWVYFIGVRNLGLDQQLFKVRFDGSRMTQLTAEPGVHRVSVDPTGRFFTDTWSSLHTPPATALRSTADGGIVRTLATSNTTRLDSLGLQRPETVTVKAADGTTDLRGVLYKPAGFDASRKYPLVVSVYGGPYVQRVTNAFEMTAPEQRLAQLGFVVWKMDNRGTPNRGKPFETATYLRLGGADLDDQVAGVQQLVRQRPYVDGSRVGIYGGSYGGYLSALALLRKPDVFHVGVAVSPVTDWKNYDSPYTERYMRTPQDNKEGYETGSTLTHARTLRGKLLLVHGTTDNNVHPANTFQLVQALVAAQKEFDLMLYPEQRHGIGGPGGQHLARLRAEYLVRHLKPETVAEVGTRD